MKWNILPHPWSPPVGLDAVPDLKSLPDPYDLPGMEAAIDRLAFAIRTGERQAVCGDYDADGISGSSLLVRALSHLADGDTVSVDLPHRLDDGYGLKPHVVDRLHTRGVRLITTVDQGVCCHEAIEHAARLGIDCIVLDHHLMEDTLPAARAVVHPGLMNEPSHPLAHLCGAGVAWFTTYALARHLGRRDVPLGPLLQLAALGTVADVVSVTGANRLIVREGLRRMATDPLPGVAAILASYVDEAEGEKDREKRRKTISAPVYRTLSHAVGPRINAAGRLAHPDLSFRLLIERDPGIATLLACEIDALNVRRRELVAEALPLAIHPHVNPLEIHPGIAGVVAGQLQEARGTPQVVLAPHNGKWHGSGRSPKGFNLRETFRAMVRAGVITTGGGHAVAAGMGCTDAQLPGFIQAFTESVARHDFPGPSIDLYPINLYNVTRALIDAVARLEPCGPGNPAPRFFTGPVHALAPKRPGNGAHLKFTASHNGTELPAIFFSAPQDLPPPPWDVAFTPSINRWTDWRNVTHEDVQIQVIAVRRHQPEM